MGRFVAGADITFARDKKYAHDAMGTFETAEEAARCTAKLHVSFNQTIYEVSDRRTKGLTIACGFRADSPCEGYEVLRTVGKAYDLISSDEWDRLRA